MHTRALTYRERAYLLLVGLLTLWSVGTQSGLLPSSAELTAIRQSLYLLLPTVILLLLPAHIGAYMTLYRDRKIIVDILQHVYTFAMILALSCAILTLLSVFLWVVPPMPSWVIQVCMVSTYLYAVYTVAYARLMPPVPVPTHTTEPLKLVRTTEEPFL